MDRESILALFVMLGINVISIFFSTQSLIVTIAQWAMPALVAPIVTRERELGTWDLLRSTPMTTRQIVWAKFAGVCVRYPFWLLALATFPAQLAVATLPGAAIGNALSSQLLMGQEVMSRNLNWQLGLASGGAGLLFIAQQISGLFATAGISLLCSTIVRRSSSAIALAYAGMIFVQMLGGGVVWLTMYILIFAQMNKTMTAGSDPSWVTMALIFVLPIIGNLIYNLILGVVGIAEGLRRAERIGE
jgi:hypothetical protein